MSVTIRNWGGFAAQIGDLSAQGLDLTLKGRITLSGLVETFLERFSAFPPVADRRTLIFTENAGPDVVRLDGRFTDLSGRVAVTSVFDDVAYSPGGPVSGESYRLSGGTMSLDAEAGLAGFCNRVEFRDYSEDYAANLFGRFFLDSGAGRFERAEFRLGDGSGYRLHGDIAFESDDALPFSGVVRSLDIFGEGGDRVATARGLRIDAADFGDDLGSFTNEVIFAGNDNVSLGSGGVFFDGWGGKDRIKGGSGHDTIDGGDGSDVLTGGAGDDVFQFSASAVVINSRARDQITDFKPGDDLLLFDLEVFGALDNADYFDSVSGDFLFDEAAADGVLTYVRGVVRYDADGSAGNGDAVVVVTLSGKPNLGNTDFAAESFVPL